MRRFKVTYKQYKADVIEAEDLAHAKVMAEVIYKQNLMHIEDMGIVEPPVDDMGWLELAESTDFNFEKSLKLWKEKGLIQ